MAGNPLVPQGVLNKLLGSVSVVSNPDLNASASFLTDDGISVTFEGEASAYLGTMTGAVPSGNPYQMVTITLSLVRTTGIAEIWREQIEDNTAIGDVVVTPDTITLDNYYFSNCTIKNVTELQFAGKSPAFVVTLQGTYYINAALFTQAGV